MHREKTILTSLMMHICAINPSMSLIVSGGDQGWSIAEAISLFSYFPSLPELLTYWLAVENGSGHKGGAVLLPGFAIK